MFISSARARVEEALFFYFLDVCHIGLSIINDENPIKLQGEPRHVLLSGLQFAIIFILDEVPITQESAVS